MDKLEHEDKGDLYIDSDGEVAVYNRDSNQPNEEGEDSAYRFRGSTKTTIESYIDWSQR